MSKNINKKPKKRKLRDDIMRQGPSKNAVEFAYI